eukprot:COSAG01_NODE_9265_length_2499_cov_9.194583_2_plen_96_part_00
MRTNHLFRGLRRIIMVGTSKEMEARQGKTFSFQLSTHGVDKLSRFASNIRYYESNLSFGPIFRRECSILFIETNVRYYSSKRMFDINIRMIIRYY